MARPLASQTSSETDSFLNAAKKMPHTTGEFKTTHRIMFALQRTDTTSEFG